MAAVTFAALAAALKSKLPVTAGRGGGLRIEIHPEQPLELFRIEVGTEEWVAVTAWIGWTASRRHSGLGVLTPCRDGWALRLTLPLAAVGGATILETAERLSLEAAALRRDERAARDVSVFQMWAT